MNLRQTEKIKETIVSEKFFDNVRGLLYNKTNIILISREILLVTLIVIVILRWGKIEKK